MVRRVKIQVSNKLLNCGMRIGLQISPDWQDYFGHPKGKTLGKFNYRDLVCV